MGCRNLVLLFCVAWWVFSVGSAQLQSSQTQVLLQLKKHLEYPKQLEIWKDRWTSFCSISSSTQVNVTCQDNFVTELSILGDKPAKVRDFCGFAIPNQTLSANFSMDSFVATLARLTSLKVLRLVSLGIWGPLPDKIHRLFALEHLDLSSNFLYGSIPPKISTMMNLQILRLDDNFFNGTISNWFNSLTNLTVLVLRNNRLKGPFPFSILSITTLTDIDMSSNEISGRLADFSSLNNLEQLDLRENKLDSVLPEMPKGLVRLFLSKNSFSGEIPKHYGQLNRLQQLDISFNTLTGKLPAKIFSLPYITYLNLASNMLSGSLQNHLNCSSELKFVDISHNRLVGGLPSCLGTESENRVVKSEGNCLSSKLQHQHAVSYCTEVHMKRKNAPGVGILVGVIVGVIVIVVLLALGFLIVCRRYWPRGISEQHLLHKTVQDSSAAAAAGFSSELLANATFISQASKLGREELPMCRPYSFEELKEATNNFDKSTFMGENLYGKLYRGKLENGKQVAVRRLPLSKKYSFRNFKLRLDLLAKLRHPHLVTLLGHCIDGVVADDNGTNVFLVYEYVPNGNFQTYLSGNSPGKVFNWSERLAVLISIAKAVHFLHTGMIPGFFKNRLKTNHILLNEHWTAKLSDYGLSLISEEADTCGGKGESPRSWEMKILLDDVYSFGFILLEALVGPSVSAKREAILLNIMASFNSHDGWKQIVDPIVQATCSRESLLIVISITNKCISPESWSRPSIEDVLWNLQYASQVQATVDGDERFDTASHHQSSVAITIGAYFGSIWIRIKHFKLLLTFITYPSHSQHKIVLVSWFLTARERKTMQYASEDRKQKRAKPNSEKDYKEEDLINQLPEGMPVAILSKLPIDEAARTSILSSKWRYLWTLFSGTLDFDGSPTMKNIKKDLKAASGWHLQVAMNIMLDFERRTYISWINELLNSLKSPTMEGLRIWFDVGFEFDVNKWIQFAMQKEVEKLELFLGSAYDYVLPLHLFHLTKVNSLRVLRLKHVNLTGDILESLLSCSPFLETLSLVKSRVPKIVKISGSSLNLKHLELVRCREMISLQIFAENLVSFRYYGCFSDTQFKSVPRLVEATFGGSYVEFIRESFISQIKELKLDITQNASTLVLWSGQFPQLNNLKHLELVAYADGITLEACILLLKSSPSLLKFTLKVNLKHMLNAKPNVRIERKFTQEKQCSLKELEMVGFSGAACEVELVKHVLELAVELQKITIDPRLPTHKPKLPPQDVPKLGMLSYTESLLGNCRTKYCPR